jgi:hypothetical protein
MWTDVSGERIAWNFKVENKLSEKPANFLTLKKRDDMFLRNVDSHVLTDSSAPSSLLCNEFRGVFSGDKQSDKGKEGCVTNH